MIDEMKKVDAVLQMKPLNLKRFGQTLNCPQSFSAVEGACILIKMGYCYGLFTVILERVACCSYCCHMLTVGVIQTGPKSGCELVTF